MILSSLVLLPIWMMMLLHLFMRSLSLNIFADSIISLGLRSRLVMIFCFSIKRSVCKNFLLRLVYLNRGNCLTRNGMDSYTDLFHDETLYRSTISALQHICVTTLDIHFAINKPSQYMQIPHISQWKAILHILRYLKSTLNHGLLL